MITSYQENQVLEYYHTGKVLLMYKMMPHEAPKREKSAKTHFPGSLHRNTSLEHNNYILHTLMWKFQPSNYVFRSIVVRKTQFLQISRHRKVEAS